MQRVAVVAKVAPVRISFVTSLRFIREQWWMDSQVGVSVGAIPAYLERLKLLLSRFVLPERKPRGSYPRAVKIKMSNYPRKRRPSSR